MIIRRAAAFVALPVLAVCLLATACTSEAPKESAIPEKFPATGDSADMKSSAKALRDYGRAHSLARVTEDVERIQERTDGHALISTDIGAEDDAIGRAEKVAAAYRAYAKGDGKEVSVTVYNVYGDSLVTR
ncbi:hypothetical protein AB0M19_34415 [Streptomyces sp. NPDC051920]|uniref:hypothetical protein n=1 Tax=Streptomyces sp. NPDC051920 TaxID=3155523 RepID=UPI0034305F81